MLPYGPGGSSLPGGRPRELADGTVRGSDHDAVVGGWGIAISPSVSQLGAFSRRPSTGCPSIATTSASILSTTDCPPVDIRAVGTRHWLTPTLGIDAALALGLGGGSDHGRLLDTYLGVGPLLGASVVLAGWKHMAVMASPAASLVVFRAASSSGTAFVLDLRADLEAELHFGFWGLPALSLGLRSGLDLHLEHGVDVTVWSLGAAGITSLSRLVSDLSLRYYL
jgi:hypothetical protein